MQTRTIECPIAASAVVAIALVIAVASAILVWRDRVPSSDAPKAQAADLARTTSVYQDYSFVLDSPLVEVLRHRPGLSPTDVVRSHAFGWKGPTIHEVTSQQRYLRILRMDPTLSPLDLVRDLAGGRSVDHRVAGISHLLSALSGGVQGSRRCPNHAPRMESTSRTAHGEMGRMPDVPKGLGTRSHRNWVRTRLAATPA